MAFFSFFFFLTGKGLTFVTSVVYPIHPHHLLGVHSELTYKRFGTEQSRYHMSAVILEKQFVSYCTVSDLKMVKHDYLAIRGKSSNDSFLVSVNKDNLTLMLDAAVACALIQCTISATTVSNYQTVK